MLRSIGLAALLTLAIAGNAWSQQMVGNCPRIFRFVKRIFFKTDGKRLDFSGRVLRRKSRDGRRIDAARKQNAERNVRNKTHPNRIGDDFAQLFCGVFNRRRAAVL